MFFRTASILRAVRKSMSSDVVIDRLRDASDYH